MGEFFPAGADGGIAAQAMEKQFDLAEGEAYVAGEANEKRAVEGVTGIAALAAGAVRRGEQAHFFVVAEGGGVKTGALRPARAASSPIFIFHFLEYRLT